MKAERVIAGGLNGLALVHKPSARRAVSYLWFTPFPVGQGRKGAPAWVDQTVSVAGLPVYVVGEGPRTALLLHGWAGSTRQFRSIAAALVEDGFTVYLMDLPAHGEAPGTSTDVPAIADAIGAVGDELGPLDLVVAHSLGSMATGLAVAERRLIADRIVLIAPGVKPRFMIAQFARELGLSAAVTEQLNVEMESRFGSEFWEAVPTTVNGLELGDRALVIHDIDDLRSPIDEGRAVAHSWGSEIVETSGNGHNGVLRSPEAVSAIRRFAGVEAGEWAKGA